MKLLFAALTLLALVMPALADQNPRNCVDSNGNQHPGYVRCGNQCCKP